VRLRRKLTVAFFGVSSLLSVLLAVFLYRLIERQLADDLRDRLRDITHIGAHVIDLDAYRRLTARAGAQGEAAVADVEHSADYRRIYDQLRVIRSAEPRLIQFAYLLAPTADPDHPRFIADADVLELRGKLAAGRPLAKHEKISHFSQPYDVSEIPLLKQALTACEPRFEPDFVHDTEFDVNSVSAYIPLSDVAGVPLRGADGRCLGVIGVDITDRKMREVLAQTSGLALKLSLAVVVLALIVSITLGTLLTRSIQALITTVKRFAEKDFSARTPELSRDEIGTLADNFNKMAATIQLHSEQLEELVHQRTQELFAEKQTSERLLLNVLPQPIAERLKTGESLIVDRFDTVSVLFADIVGFTAMSSRTSPEELVTMLNDLFSTFDRLAEQHGLEKIKTIGDAYMVVAGIPQPVADHATAIAHMALDMMAGVAEYAARVGVPLTIRVGIHTGSVVAGVIGKKKFIYDLWGDTVNLASRMESTGLPGRIQVSEATYELLRDLFDFEERGPIEVKGKGQLSVYLLLGPKEDPARISVTEIAGE
jgi:class 3 adenylate cyclase